MHLFKRPKSRKPTTSNLTRMWNNRNFLKLLVAIKIGIATLEDNLVIAYKTKHLLPIQSSNYAPWYLPKGVENLGSQRIAQIFIAVLFIIAETWKSRRCLSVGEWMKNCGTSRKWNIIQH